jgi:hypothetical protein
MDEFRAPELTKQEEKYREKVQSKIEYCLNCQPFEDGEAFWMLGERTELDDLFFSCNVPERHWGKVMAHLYCPNCSTTGFSLSLDVGVKTKFQKEVDKHMDEAYALYGNHVRLFEDELEKFPLLAMNNKVAKDIFKEISAKSLPVIVIKGEFYRARKVETSVVVEEKHMFNPPIGKSLEGRFNHAGQSHLYLANEKVTALRETVVANESVLVWVQKFQIEKEIDNILDLSFEWDNLSPTTNTLLISLNVFGTIQRKDRNNENWRPDYFLTRFIMDCAKKSGYNGIKYNSSKDTYSFNIVLFYPDNKIIKPDGKPCIEIFLKEKDLKQEIVDF